MIYYSHPNDRMEIALTFDDGPHPRLTPVILDILAEYGIKATFFMVGENVGYYPAAARAVAEAGHEIGNHTFSHRKFGRMGEEELLREIANCEAAVSGFSDTPLRLIRPPEGQMSDTMRRVIGSLDYRVILWDVDTRDWAHTSPEDISRHILDTVEAGDIILMHDFIGYDSPTPAALRLVIPALLERGYRFVTVGELIDGE
jgi:peptidoglycan/xylan/chitin deacetylase (PgdA/CDA1 family)